MPQVLTTTITIDLPAYLHRLRLNPGDVAAPTVAALRRLHRAHVATIPFVNVEAALGRVPDLELGAVERRLVHEGRGGYCLEHVTLYAAVLDALGFAPALRLAAVGSSEHLATHLSVLVRPIDDARRWSSDVGFGLGVLVPLPVPATPGSGDPVRCGMFTHRVDLDCDGHLHLVERDAGGWRRLHTAADEDVSAFQVADANRRVATEAWSPFAGRLVAMRTEAHVRERLRGTAHEVLADGAPPHTTELTPAGALRLLGERFGVRVPAEDRGALLDLLHAAG